MPLPSVSIITTCKGRLDHLKQSLPTWLVQNYAGAWEIVVVDYDCPDGTAEWLRSLGTDRVRCVEVRDNALPFHMNHARNVGVTAASGGVLALLDADNIASPEYLTRGINAMLSTGAKLCNTVTEVGGMRGCCFIDAASLLGLNGFDEAFVNYGFCDIDLYDRFLARWPTLATTIPESLLTIIDHTDAERMANYAEKDIDKSKQANRDRSSDALLWFAYPKGTSIRYPEMCE